MAIKYHRMPKLNNGKRLIFHVAKARRDNINTIDVTVVSGSVSPLETGYPHQSKTRNRGRGTTIRNK